MLSAQDSTIKIRAKMDNTRASVTFWTDETHAANLSIDVKVPRREFKYFEGFTRKDVKEWWPLCQTGYKSEDQENQLKALQRFSKQPHREEGDYVVVTESYKPPKSGYPGRLFSPGCQGQVRAIRSNLLKETWDIDMSMGMQRVILFVCNEFKVPAAELEYFIKNRDGDNGMLRRIMEETGVSKGKAKQLSIMAYTDENKLFKRSTYLKALDAEAKEIQKRLMVVPELQWILPFCKKDNRAGSFMSHLYHFIECKLLMRVHSMLINELGIEVVALVFDGLNIANKNNHGNEEILDRARTACEEIAPGINMVWAWKELDFVLESKEKKPLTNADGTDKELRVPESYKARPPKQLPDGSSSLDPDTQPSYEKVRDEFSLGLSGKHGKVGCEYIRLDETGKVELFDTAHFKAHYRHMVYFYETEEEDGTVVKSSAFIDKWMNDERMDPRYIKEKTERYYWERFDMYPNKSDCPANVYQRAMMV